MGCIKLQNNQPCCKVNPQKLIIQWCIKFKKVNYTNILIMGTSHSQIQNEDLFKSFQKLEWSKVKDQGLYELWSNHNTSQICEAYKLDYVPDEQDLEHYRFRHYKQNADNFVEIRYIDIEQNPTLCYHGQTYVLTEFIPVKLAEMHNLPQNEGYSILRSTYRAFHTMEAFHGPFIPNEELIGINLDGKPKIWLNKNHSKNRADSMIKAQIWQKHVGQVSENVKRIFQMVEQRVMNKRFPTEFRNFIHENLMNFSQASEFVQDYCQQHRITIPNTIKYAQFLHQPQLVQIIDQLNMKRQVSSLNDKLNTMESTYEHEKYTVKENTVKQLKRADSHQLLGYRQNVNFLRPRQDFNFLPNNSHLNLIPVQKSVFSPVIPKNSKAHIVIPPRGLIIHRVNQQSKVSGAQITNLSQANLRSTISVMQLQQIPRQIKTQNQKVVLYKNLKTPAHVTGTFPIIPPNKLTQFELPVRKQSQKFQSVKSGSVGQSASKETESIHEKIKELENDEVDYLNEQILDENTKGNKDQPRMQEFHKYISENSEIHPQKSEDLEQNVTSQPDWQNIQQQKDQMNQQRYYSKNMQTQHHDQRYEEYRYEPQVYEVNLDINKSAYKYDLTYQKEHYEISPIKQNPVKNTQQFQNHYAMFTKYAQINSNQNLRNIQRNHRKLQQNHQNLQHNHLRQQVANSSSFQPRNQGLNKSVTISDQDRKNSSVIKIEEPTIKMEDNQKSLTQPYHISGIQSLQKINQNSSKNTSLNKDSTGTLIVHQSQQNIYNGINYDEKNDKINVNRKSIQQNSQQSEKQQILDNNSIRKQMMNLIKQADQHRINNTHQAIDQKDYHQLPFRDLEFNAGKYGWGIEADHYDQVRQSGQFAQQKQPQKPQKPVQDDQKVNSYTNLHFRNESDELYQYTPVESVYRTQTEKQNFHSFSRPSGVQEIVQLERHQQIQQYIRNKYSGMIQGNPLPPKNNQTQPNPRPYKKNNHRAMTFAKPLEPQQYDQKQIQTRQYDAHAANQQKSFEVNRIESIYQKINNHENHIIQPVQRFDVKCSPESHDFLDVGNLEKSLDKKYKPTTQNKYSSPKSSHNVRGSQTMSQEDGMNVAALQKRLLKFEERQSIERQKSQRKIETQNDQLLNNNNELNFNQLDNIVELMDKKIQQSQKKQQNKSTEQLKSSQKVTQFNPGKNSIVEQLQNIELQTSINNMQTKEISLKDIPVLAKDKVSNASNSKSPSKRDYYNKYGIDSEDFASGKGSVSNDYGNGKESYSFNKKQSRNFQSKRADALMPVVELDRKYKNYIPNKISLNENDLPGLNVGSLSSSQSQKSSSRRSSRQVEQANRLAEKISSKYDKYISSENSSKYDVEKPFAKKSYSNIVQSQDNNQKYIQSSNSSSRYISNSSKNINEEAKKISKGSRVSARDFQRKKSSYLNPIEELNCQNYASPLKQSTTPYQNQQNYIKLSYQNSRAPSERNPDNRSRKSSKVSYDELRDLLWK